MERQPPTPPPRGRVRDAALYARWRALASRWWREHAPPPRHHTRMVFYNADILKDMTRLSRLMRVEWPPGDSTLQVPAGAVSASGAAGGGGGGGGSGGGGGGGGSGGSGGGGGGGGAGAVLLLLLLGVVIVRLSEKFVNKLLRGRGRRNGEWQGSVPAISGCRVEDLEGGELEPSLDQPPPYAFVADPGANVGPKPGPEEPPPPYSECFVALKGSTEASESPRDSIGDTGDAGDVPPVGIAPEEMLSALCGCCECEELRREGVPGSVDAVETCV